MGNLPDPYRRYAKRLKEAVQEQDELHRKLDRLESEVRGHKQRMKQFTPYSEGDPVLERKNSPKGHNYGFIYRLKVRKTRSGNFRVFADLCTPDEENGEFPDEPQENQWAENVNVAELTAWEPPNERDSPVDTEVHEKHGEFSCPRCGVKRDFYLIRKMEDKMGGTTDSTPEPVEEYELTCEWCGYVRKGDFRKYPNE